jgi:hypothetical protein
MNNMKNEEKLLAIYFFHSKGHFGKGCGNIYA